MLRWFSCLTLLVVLMPAVARAGDKELPPTVRVQIRSLDAVIDNLKLLVTLSGREEIAKQVEGLIKTKIGNKGLEGIDPARPFGAYSRLGKDLNDATGVLLLPIADEKAFLALLENLNVMAEKNDKTGIYTIRGGIPVALYFRFANKYAYVTALNLEALDAKNLLPPNRVFDANSKAAISASLQLDQLPETLKFIVKAQFEQGIQEAQDKKIPGETKVQKDFRLQLTRQIVDDVATVFTDGKNLGLEFNIDKASKEMSVTLSLAAQDKTALAKQIEALGKSKHLFGGLWSKDAALHGSVTLALPKTLQKTFDAVIEEAQAKILKEARDPAKRKQADDLLKALAPTFKAGALDAAVTFQGPGKEKHFTIVAGVRVQDGNQLNTTFRELVEDVIKQMPAAEQEKIKLDAATVAGTKIHRFDMSSHYDAKAKEIFGASPAFIAIRDDAVFYAIGPDGQNILKTALSAKPDSSATAFALEISVARLVPLMAKTGPQQEKVQALFPDGEDGTVRVSVDGGDTLRVRLSTRLSVVRFLGALGVLRENKGD